MPIALKESKGEAGVIARNQASFSDFFLRKIYMQSLQNFQAILLCISRSEETFLYKNNAVISNGASVSEPSNVYHPTSLYWEIKFKAFQAI